MYKQIYVIHILCFVQYEECYIYCSILCVCVFIFFPKTEMYLQKLILNCNSRGLIVKLKMIHKHSLRNFV
jgi:hypothetical protein